MRKQLVALVLLLFAVPTFAGGGATMMMVMGSPPVAGGTCDDCSGSRIFSWHMENINIELGTPCGCSDDATKTATYSGDFALSTDNVIDGTYTGYRVNASDYATVPLTGTSTTQGYISWGMDAVNVVSGSIKIVELYYDNNNFFRVSQSSSDALTALYTGNGAARQATTTALTIGNAYSCYAYYIQGGNPTVFIHCDGGITDGSTGLSLTAMASATNSLIVGDNTAQTAAAYIDNVHVYNVYNP